MRKGGNARSENRVDAFRFRSCAGNSGLPVAENARVAFRKLSGGTSLEFSACDGSADSENGAACEENLCLAARRKRTRDFLERGELCPPPFSACRLGVFHVFSGNLAGSGRNILHGKGSLPSQGDSCRFADVLLSAARARRLAIEFSRGSLSRSVCARRPSLDRFCRSWTGNSLPGNERNEKEASRRNSGKNAFSGRSLEGGPCAPVLLRTFAWRNGLFLADGFLLALSAFSLLSAELARRRKMSTRGLAMNRFGIFLALAACLLAGCRSDRESLCDLELQRMEFRGHSPVAVNLYDSSSVWSRLPAAWRLGGYFVREMAEVDFASVPGDTLCIRILEFTDDVSALAFYLNSGLVQETLPVVVGNFREIAMRSGRRLFVFRYGILRNYGRAELERYVQAFPGYRSGLPQEFLSLPFSQRVSGETSIQVRNFLGVPADFPMLVQGYRGDDVSWNAARSWKYVSPDSWRAWVLGLQRKSPDVSIAADTVRFDAGAGTFGMALRLPFGRVVCVWGYLSAETLQKRFESVARSVYDSPE